MVEILDEYPTEEGFRKIKGEIIYLECLEDIIGDIEYKISSCESSKECYLKRTDKETGKEITVSEEELKSRNEWAYIKYMEEDQKIKMYKKIKAELEAKNIKKLQ